MRTAEEMEQIIKGLPAVLGVRVGLNDQAVGEVHVLASADRHPMQIVRDIESAVLAHLGIALDRRIISVAQLRDDGVEAPRLVLDTVNVRFQGDVTHITVELTANGLRHTGSASGPSARTQRLRTAASATLQAVEASLGGRIHLFVDEIGIAEVNAQEAVVVTVGLQERAEQHITVGCSFVWRDDAESAARAALSAINRRYGALLSSAHLGA